MSYFSKQYHTPGTAPGTLVPKTGGPAPLSILLMDYTPDQVEEHQLASAADCTPFLERDTRTWIQVNGQVDAATLRHLGELFDLHDLALEDVLNSGQRPKMELYDEQMFVTLALPVYEDHKLNMIQISLFVGTNYLICFCPLDVDLFEPVRKRMRAPNNKRFANRQIDYLLYALMDLVIDEGFPVLEAFGDQFEHLEEQLLERPSQQTLSDIHDLKRELLVMRRTLWPQREMVGSLLRSDEALISADTFVYFRDCHDHSVQIIELLESYRDMATGMLDIYLSSVTNRTNETMRVLTMIATLFIPLTFIVGIYGMNFEHANSPWAMPELGWYYGYPLVWGLMVVVTVGLVWFFKKRHWL
ncbi:MAG: magnesium/cobalt transporter CorA [Oleiphilaceae bacterium]|nr:magnesium/cobalt transporter CorA [Oleiphilaceae bacterium]